MVLEAIEDHKRGWKAEKAGLGGERVARGVYAIEHIMPRKWAPHWPATDGFRGEADRDRLIHTVGNLTLLTDRLNAKVSNAPWLGAGGKREKLSQHDVFFLNRELRECESWTDDSIRARSDDLANTILEIWPVPPGHRSAVAQEKPRPRHKVDLADLLSAGLLQPGMPLFPKPKKFAAHAATLLPTGEIEVDGTVYGKPSAAAAAIRAKPTNGWGFFIVDQAKRRSLRDVWRQYVDAMSVDIDDDEASDDDDDDEG